MGKYPWGWMNHKLANGMKIWKENGNTTTLLFTLIGLKMLHQERRIQVNTIVMEHFESILFHKSRPASKQHAYQSMLDVNSPDHKHSVIWGSTHYIPWDIMYKMNFTLYCFIPLIFVYMYLIIWLFYLFVTIIWFGPRGKESTEVRITQNKGKESENSYQKLKRSQ